MPVASPIRAASRVERFSYAIRNIVSEARRVEQSGRTVTYLNIGDPIQFGFRTPAPLVEAAHKALAENCNGYVPSPGIPSAREAVAAEWTAHGFPATADRVLITGGTSEGIELALSALVEPGDSVLVPMPTYPLYTAVLAKIDAEPLYYRKEPSAGWLPDLDHIESLVTSRTRALVVIDPNNPTGAVYPDAIRRALIELAERHGLTLLADEVYGDLAFDGPVAPMGSLAPDAAVISFSSLSKGFIAPGWRAGWLVVGRTPRLDGVLAAIKKLADGRLCSNGVVQYAIPVALAGDRGFQSAFRAALRDRADLTARTLNALPGFSCVPPAGAFYAMPKVSLPDGRTDEEFVLELLRRTGVLCVHGSGFGLPASEGYFRIVCLASPRELAEIYQRIGSFSNDFLQM